MGKPRQVGLVKGRHRDREIIRHRQWHGDFICLTGIAHIQLDGDAMILGRDAITVQPVMAERGQLGDYWAQPRRCLGVGGHQHCPGVVMSDV